MEGAASDSSRKWSPVPLRTVSGRASARQGWQESTDERRSTWPVLIQGSEASSYSPLNKMICQRTVRPFALVDSKGVEESRRLTTQNFERGGSPQIAANLQR